MNLLYGVLDDSVKNKKFISVKRYGDEKYLCGRVLDYSKDLIQFSHYTPYGIYDGIINIKLSTVECFEVDNDASNIMNIIVENMEDSNMYNYPIIKYPPLTQDNDWQYKILKDYLGSEDYIAEIEIEQNKGISYIGLVDGIDTEFFKMKNISASGIADGYSLYKISDISFIGINTMEGKKRLYLYKHKINETI